MPSADDCATLQAYFEGVDQARAEAETKWGAGRLQQLVDDETRAKFLRQQGRWSQALQAAWEAPFLSRDGLADVQRFAAAQRRAWAAMDAIAEEAGHRPIFPDVWEALLSDGTVVAVVRTDAEASKVIADGRHVAVYTLREVANVIEALPQVLRVAKVEWPGAKVQPPSDRSWVKQGDELPF